MAESGPQIVPAPQCAETAPSEELHGNGGHEPEGMLNKTDCGLLHYRKWWEREEADILVQGKLVTGIPILIEENTMRVINNTHSYFIPMEKIDYIRTTDGLRSCSHSFDDIPIKKKRIQLTPIRKQP